MRQRSNGGGGDKTQTISIVVASPNDFLARRIAAALRAQPDVLVVAVTANGDAAVAAVQTQQPHAALVDPELCTTDGESVLDVIRRDCPATRAIASVGAPSDAVELVRGSLSNPKSLQ